MKADLDRLYAAPLAEFTATRNEIAAGLDDRAQAAAVKALKKPSTVAWVLNQLPRRHPDLVEALLAAGRALRAAHRRALSKGGSAGLRDASAQEREAVAAMLRAADGVMRDAGIPPSRGHEAAIEETLRAAVVDEEAGALLAQGRLAREISRAGFGDVRGLTVIAGGTARPAPDEPAEDRIRAREAEREARTAEREALRLERVAETARERERRLRAALEEAAAEATRTAEAAEAARVTARAARERAGGA